ncbi:hypothetical protein HC358_01300 [Wolbachia pipientis]|uniref:Uncharacterized protein n=1 Tax=Wolbachia pipientis TaxID=955 RepID=A0A7G5C982_WOLPI|nr:hypothetical protein [Wolbachia pipientis]QMV45766.1 hypothetical protein HC358_01300 [Wolbachia pipientis]
MVTDTKDPFKDYFDFLGFRKLSDQPSRILSSIRKYSGTISIASTIAALIAFTTFSIQPVIVSIAGFAFTPAPLAFIPLAVLLFTAVINFINTQKIKENEIDKKVGNYQVDEQYSQIVQGAEKIEIVTKFEWKEKINGKASDFLYYLLESIKLKEKSDQKEKVSEATLRNFDNKIIIHWKDGSQTTCHIKKQVDLPSTKVDFVNQNIQAAWEMARGKSL